MLWANFLSSTKTERYAFSLCAGMVKCLSSAWFVRWCNGNTAPFGGVIHGSNPCRTATQFILPTQNHEDYRLQMSY